MKKKTPFVLLITTMFTLSFAWAVSAQQPDTGTGSPQAAVGDFKAFIPGLFTFEYTLSRTLCQNKRKFRTKTWENLDTEHEFGL